MSPPLRLAVFDVDGTLVDSQHNIVAAMQAACECCGHPAPAAAQVRRVIGLSLLEAVAALLPQADPNAHAAVTEAYKDAFIALRQRPDHHEPLFPGALESLAALEREGWLLGLATGKARRGVNVMIERHGLEGRFVTIQTPDDNPGKPHPGMLLAAMDAVGVGPEHTVMIGDTTFDIQMARGARAHALGVAWGYHDVEELHAAGAHAVVDHHRDLPVSVTRLVGGVQCVSALS